KSAKRAALNQHPLKLYALPQKSIRFLQHTPPYQAYQKLTNSYVFFHKIPRTVSQSTPLATFLIHHQAHAERPLNPLYSIAIIY
ncbi:hypothetical protein, partial [Marinobacter sp.]|uniref:hypothetical protein n=1 Tax=Marinobacter sp. TaxID=50741 RepID=UPI0035695CA1